MIAGVDCGKAGALVIMDNTGSVVEICRPVIINGDYDLIKWSMYWQRALLNHRVSHVMIEKVGASPQMGVTSAFNFGYAFGVASAVAALSVPSVSFISPMAWKAKYNLIGQDKKASIEKAKSLNPSIIPHVQRMKDDGIAEAFLIGRLLIF